MNNCFGCKNHEEVPGNYHIRCKKPDPEMTGNEHGKASGWFLYPFLFDPVWATKRCKNYDPVKKGDD